MGFIMLDDFLCSNIVHCYVLRFCCCNHALLSWMENSLCNWSIKTIILLNTLLAFHIPHHQLLVLTSWNYRCHISWKLWCCNPVGMANVGTLKLKGCNIPKLNTFIVTWWQYKVSIRTETDWSNCSCMTLDSFCFCVSTWIPQFD